MESYCGYLDRDGKFYDCSSLPGNFKHNVMCEDLGLDEEILLEHYGWVKLSLSLPETYIYYSFRPLSEAQADWLSEHGYVLDSLDMEEWFENRY